MPHPAILLDLQYLPCLQYWSKLAAYSTVYIEQHENFVKSSYRTAVISLESMDHFAYLFPLPKVKMSNKISDKSPYPNKTTGALDTGIVSVRLMGMHRIGTIMLINWHLTLKQKPLPFLNLITNSFKQSINSSTSIPK